MFARLNQTFREFPRQFWVVVITSFVDGIGNTMVFPFFALYITQKFHVGMTQAGMLLGTFSLAGLVGGGLGGALTDKFGRRKLILFGLVFSAVSSILLGVTNSLFLMYPISAMIGFIGSISGPAQGAMIADILPESKRSEGFGILRVVGNMTWIVGPTIAGFVASKSFLALFLTDAAISCIVAMIVYRFIRETRPGTPEDHQEQSIRQTMSGYGVVFRDFPFIAFILASIVMGVVYLQMYGSLSVYLRDNYGIDPQGYGVLMSTSAVTVILFQFWTTRQIKTRPPFQMMALGAVFYAIGFTLFGIVQTFALFALNIIIITVGEMIVMPTSQTLAASFAPENMRGRYMAVFGLSWAIPSTVGPGAAGYILDNYNPQLLWYFGGILTLISAAGFIFLHLRLGAMRKFAPEKPEALSLSATSD
jgi:MFS family permease